MDARRDPAVRADSALAKFARAVIRQYAWGQGEPDGGDIQELAEKFGLIRPTPFDPKRHRDSEGFGLEEGDPWYELAGPLLGRNASHDTEAADADA